MQHTHAVLPRGQGQLHHTCISKAMTAVVVNVLCSGQTGGNIG